MAESGPSTDDPQDTLECCICMKDFSNPRMLPCIHTFCLKCLKKVAHGKTAGEHLDCPVCKSKFVIPEDGLEGIPKNVFIESRINIKCLLKRSKKILCDVCSMEDNQEDSVPTAVMFCVECNQKLCDDCCKYHRRIRAVREHQLIPTKDKDKIKQLTEDFTRKFCEHHANKPIEVYCLVCKSVNCCVCQLERHQGHKHKNIDDVGREFRIQLKRSIEKINATKSSAKEEIKMLDVSYSSVLNKTIALQAEVAKRAERMKAIIDDHAKQLQMELDLIKTSNQKNIDIKKEQFNFNLAVLKSYEKYARRIVKKASAVDICRVYLDMEARSVELVRNHDSMVSELGSSLENVACFSLCASDIHLGRAGNVIGQIQTNFLKLSEMFKIESTNLLAGVTWMDNRIYVVFEESTQVRVFMDHQPFEEYPLEGIDIEDMRKPIDITALIVSRSIIISDWISHCLWTIDRPSKTISKIDLEGQPETCSITPWNGLLVVVMRDDRFYLNTVTFKSHEADLAKSIGLPLNVIIVRHAVQSLNGNFIMIYRDLYHSIDPYMDLISEMSADGEEFVWTFDPLSTTGPRDWLPGYLSIDSEGRIVVADLYDDRVIMLNSGTTHHRIFRTEHRGQINRHKSLVYLPEKQQLIVAQSSSPECPASVYIFHLFQR